MSFKVMNWGVCLSTIIALGVVSWRGAALAQPKPAPQTSAYLALSSISAVEIPAKAAELVKAAAAADRDKTVDEVLRTAVVLARPGTLPYIVSAVSKANPPSVQVAIATATELQPKDVIIFTHAALAAAPDQVEQIVFAGCRCAPSYAGNIAIAASHQFPKAKDEILAGFANALPALQSYLQEAKTSVGTNDCDAIIKQTAQLWAEAYKQQ